MCARACACACVRACVCVCVYVRACACVCLLTIGGQTAGPIITKLGTHNYEDISWSGSYLKLAPCIARKGWAHWAEASGDLASGDFRLSNH